ncbi:MAG: hypothetical protein A3H91_06295 [Gammaproteobacteria bacterium RIFCSPLOWO2_02_FULL_61_13]|nr:MAG: hypothetical protein A3H91_06295 [Gammaproteobacteria bacterium RIFCSPLOWO2_02_FULL_61_13]
MRIFLIGLSEGFSRSLARYVGGDARLALAGVAPSLALAGLMIPATQAHLALIDWAALEALPVDALQLLRQARPGLRIVCVVDDNEAYRCAAAQAGADAVISKAGFAVELQSLLHDFLPGRFGARGSEYA